MVTQFAMTDGHNGHIIYAVQSKEAKVNRHFFIEN